MVGDGREKLRVGDAVNILRLTRPGDGVEQCAALQNVRINRQLMGTAKLLHGTERQTLRAVVQKSGGFRLDRVKMVRNRQLTRRVRHRQRMHKPVLIQVGEEAVKPLVALRDARRQPVQPAHLAVFPHGYAAMRRCLTIPKRLPQFRGRHIHHVRVKRHESSAKRNQPPLLVRQHLGRHAGRARADNEGAQRQYLLKIPPCVQLHQRVRTNQVKKLCLGIILMQNGQRIYRIDNAFAVDFRAARRQSVMQRTGAADHAPAIFRGGDAYLVRRIARREYQHAVKMRTLHGGKRHMDVPLMNRVERAA